MAGQNTPKDDLSWLRESERRTRILERHSHRPITADVQAMLLLRAQNLLVGGGTRTVISTGVHWSSPFYIAGIGIHPLGAPTGVLTIGLPANGTVIPVHGDSDLASRTVGTGTTSGYVPLSGAESLWYDLPVVGSDNEGSTGTDSLGFHIIRDWDTATFPPATWVRIVTRQDLSGSSPMYVWGDMVRQG